MASDKIKHRKLGAEPKSCIEKTICFYVGIIGKSNAEKQVNYLCSCFCTVPLSLLSVQTASCLFPVTLKEFTMPDFIVLTINLYKPLFVHLRVQCRYVYAFKCRPQYTLHIFLQAKLLPLTPLQMQIGLIYCALFYSKCIFIALSLVHIHTTNVHRHLHIAITMDSSASEAAIVTNTSEQTPTPWQSSTSCATHTESKQKGHTVHMPFRSIQENTRGENC